MDDLKRKIELKRRAFERFDALPEERQKELTAVGQDPHEPKATRERKKEAALERRKREFDRLPMVSKYSE